MSPLTLSSVNSPIQIIFVTTPTGNVRERPSRLLELSSYTRPMTYIASDGSEIANKLQSSFHSLITDGSSEMFSDMTLDDKIIDEVRWKPDVLELSSSVSISVSVCPKI